MNKLHSFYQSGVLEAGCDEAGRGCLAGPVVAAAVILPDGFHHPLLNDSKQVSKKKRELLYPLLKQEAKAWAIGVVDHVEIDKINILNASFKAMHRAIIQLKVKPESLLIDGNRFNAFKDTPHHCMIKGDARFMSIAAASILAKTYRDQLMQRLHDEFPIYGWDSNKGYPTVKHREAIEKYGISKYHRKSFTLFTNQQKLTF